MRTPEQQVAFEALKLSDEKAVALARARDKFFSTEPPEAVVAKFAIKTAVEQILSLAAAEVAEAKNFQRVLDAIEVLSTAKHAWDLLPEMRERREALEALTKAAEESGKALGAWRTANERARNVPVLDHVLSKPFTMVFTNDNAGKSVAIVARSTDGVTKAITPINPISISGSWDGGISPSILNR